MHRHVWICQVCHRYIHIPSLYHHFLVTDLIKSPELMWFLEMTVINSWLCCIYRLLACLPFFSWWDPVCRRPHLDNIPALLFICDRFKTWLMIDECSSHCSWQQDRCFMRLWWTRGIFPFSVKANIEHSVVDDKRARTRSVLSLILLNDVWRYCWWQCECVKTGSCVHCK